MAAFTASVHTAFRMWTVKSSKTRALRAGKLCAAPLLRSAAALFAYVGDRLEEGKLAGPVAQEHGLLLRQLLLPVPDYCQEASIDAFSSTPAGMGSLYCCAQSTAWRPSA